MPIVVDGQLSPDGSATFDGYYFNLSLNNAGQVLSQAYLSNTSDHKSFQALFRFDELNGAMQIARAGQASPDGNGTFDGFRAFINEVGQVAFTAHLTGTAGGNSDDRGLYIYDDQQGLAQLVREGDPFLGSTIVSLANYTIAPAFDLNSVGQVAFIFELADQRRGIALVSMTTIPEPDTVLLLATMTIAISLRRWGSIDPEL